MKSFLALIVLLGTSSAFANVAIECGTNVNFDDGIVGQRRFLISAEDGQDAKVFDAANKVMKNATLANGPKGSLILTIVTGKSVTGPVGTKFVIDNYSGENFTVAHESILGGFAAGTNVGKLDCTVIEM